MTTLDGAANHHNSDSEDDLDYVPEGEGQDSDTDSEERDPKRPRVEGLSPTQEDLAAAKSERQALWAKFQESVKTPSTLSKDEPEKRMVKIVKRHRFAGEDVVEIVDVPEDSADAKKWPLWKPPEGQNEAAVPHGSGSGTPTPSTEEPPPVATTTTTTAAASASSVPSGAQAQPLTTKRPPIRRKPKLQLAELPSSAAGSQKGGAKKLTTLEKSALDWKAHLDTTVEPELASELEANRRNGGGGYLDKVEFLQRVGDRKGQTFEANKDHKRRRG